MVFPLLIISLAFFADRLSKWWALQFLGENGQVEVGTLLTIQETYNRGLAFGLLQGAGPVIGWLSILIVAAMLVYIARLPREMWVARLGMALIIGGALGNMLDRIVAGRVLDFIVTPIRPGVFNVADVLINVGMVICILGLLFHRPVAPDPIPTPANMAKVPPPETLEDIYPDL